MAEPYRVDGSWDLSSGCDSGRNPIVQSALQPNGIKRNQLAWMVNATVRGGGVRCRDGWKKLNVDTSAITALVTTGKFQGAGVHSPDNAHPYLLCSISGRETKWDVENLIATDVSIGGDLNSSLLPQTWHAQGEQFTVIQDGQSLPLFWDGNVMRRSNGLLGNELTTGTVMNYYMGRFWVARANTYIASDLVFDQSSGTAAYNYRDSILKITENAFLAGGGAFFVPSQGGPITALNYTANMNTALGQGQLIVGTRKAVYATDVPPDRTTWNSFDNVGKLPLQRVMQNRFGPMGQDSVVAANGDLFYRSVDGWRSYYTSVRNFQQWGNTPISSEMDRALVRDDRSLLHYSSGVNFNNRMLQTVSPVFTSRGTYHTGLGVLDFDLVSTIQDQKPPAWEGVWGGLKIFRVLEADFGGFQRCFAFVLGETDEIELWEITSGERFDQTDHRIVWSAETARYDFGDVREFKKLLTLKLWFDRMAGDVDGYIHFRPDSHPCWVYWGKISECAPINSCQDTDPDFCFLPKNYQEQFRSAIAMPEPPDTCIPQTKRPAKLGYTFQFRITIKGFARLCGITVFASPTEVALYENLSC